jgi:transcriptional regulator with XRE-family HTH domain
MTTRRKGPESSRHVLSLAEHLRQAASDSGLSVYRIAKDTGVDQSTLNKFLTGARDNLRLDVADRLFRFFFRPPLQKRRGLGRARLTRFERGGPAAGPRAGRPGE